MITLDIFKNNYDPTNYQDITPGDNDNFILFFYNTATTTSGANISTVTTGGVNISNTLKNLKSFAVDLLFGSTVRRYTFNIGTVEALDGYYHLVFTEPVNVGGEFEEGDLYNIEFNPAIGNVNFEKSEYEAIKNNAIDNRTTSFIYDVDRSKYSEGALPVNFDAIINGTATPAQYQELNYSSIGLTNSRYEGAETSKAEYGITPAIGLITFEGKAYNADVENDVICSQSADIINLDTFGFVVNSPGETTHDIVLPSSQDYPTAISSSNTGGNSDIEIHGAAGQSVDATQTVLNVVINSGTEVEVEDIFVLRPSNNGSVPEEDFVEVEKVDGNTLTVKRGLLGISKTVTEDNINNELYLYKIKSDTVYSINNSRISKLGRKKLFIPDTGNILIISTTGRVIRIEKTCGI